MALAELAIIVAACVIVQAFFAASEIALVAADDAKLRAAGEREGKRASMLESLLLKRDRLLALVLTTNNLATVIAAAVLTTFLHRIGPHYSYLAPFILAPITLLLGESIPKLLALRGPLAFAAFAARPLLLMAAALAPLLKFETMLSRWLRKLAGVSPEIGSVFLTREDLALLLWRDADGHGPVTDAILPAEQQMISRIFRFTHSEARKVMVPQVQIEAVPDDITLAATIEVARREGFSRLPVFHKRIFDIIGVVHVFDLLEAPDLTRPVTEVMRPVSYFSESTPLDEILLAMQRTGENLAVVVDEYGGASGILTVEDLLEEIVGEIEDEYDAREELTTVLNARSLAVLARAPIAELNDRFGLNLPEGEEYATIGGLVVERLGHIAKPGEQFKVGDVTITVTRSDARAVREVIIGLDRPLRVDRTRHR
ncbi:MAG: HlyC/CorC family transporter [Candidatus Binataceae bacterium]|nr:HlyC/CorC family transporter [Candidatus Binataceae bacterium]